MMREHLGRMSRYNQWANRRLFEACTQLPEGEFERARPAFFRSIAGTLNHLLITDQIWMDRLAGRPYGGAKLDDLPFPRLDDLRAARETLDQDIIAMSTNLDEAALAGTTTYRMMTKPQDASMPTLLCWLHVFNHQTHHRGQVHDQLKSRRKWRHHPWT